MKIIIKIFKPLIKRYILKELAKVETRTVIVDIANSKIDIPKLNEEEEGVLLGQIYVALYDALVKVIDRL